MKVLITGANGFLGWWLTRQLLEKGYEVIATGKGSCRLPYESYPGFTYQVMDFTDPFVVHDVFEIFRPEFVVHAGAISKPDECEMDQWNAWVANVEATITLLLNAGEWNSFFIFLSTDFIFDGEKGMYREEDSPGPVNFYGKTKLEAEEAVREYPFDWSIVRTVLVYGNRMGGRHNLVTLIKDKLEKGEYYQVFDDQVRTPTYVEDLADGIVRIIEKKATGVFHLSGRETITPYEMACKTADHLGLDKNLIRKITAVDLKQPARRPLKTGFDISKARIELGFNPRSIEEGLEKTFSDK